MGDMADMVNNDYRPDDGQDPQPEDYITNLKTMKHTFDIMSTKTARKDNTKYLGKSGEQAYRVSTKIGEEWYANMIYDEALLPVKGKSYEIELTEEGEWLNWDYKLLSKKEQILEQTAPPVVEQVPPPITEEMAKEVFTPTKEEVDWDKIAEGKTRCAISCAMIEAKINIHEIPKEAIDSWVTYIMTGK